MMAPNLAQSTLLGLLAIAAVADASSMNRKRSEEDQFFTDRCTSLNERRAWSSLSDTEKQEYIDAELCLRSATTQLNISGAANRYDEVQNVHIQNAAVIHSVGAFLPWHRLYTRAHEILLQSECGYTGAQPYWDENNDANAGSGSLANASVFRPSTWFGSNGAGGDGNSCVADGAFANTTLRLSYARSNNNNNNNNDQDAGGGGGEYCLSRAFDDATFLVANDTYLAACQAAANYTDYNDCMGYNPHRAAHGGIAGTMASIADSPGDPLFWLHHAWIDRFWWQWQSADPAARLYAIGGDNVPSNGTLAYSGFDYPSNAILDYDGDNGTSTTTLNHNLWMTGIIPNRTVAQVANLTGAVICATYIDP